MTAYDSNSLNALRLISVNRLFCDGVDPRHQRNIYRAVCFGHDGLIYTVARNIEFDARYNTVLRGLFDKTRSVGFGIKFEENQFCKGVLTLYFDDIVTDVDGVVLFEDDMADKIIDFIEKFRSEVDTLLVHCYAGQSRSRAVGAFAVEMLGGDNSKYFEDGVPNQYIYDVLESAWIRRQLNMLSEE